MKIAQALTTQTLKSKQHEITLISENSFNFHKNINILEVNGWKNLSRLIDNHYSHKEIERL